MPRSQLVLFITVTLFTTYAVLYYATNIQSIFIEKAPVRLERLNKENYVLITEGCKVPKYDPFDSTVLGYYTKTNKNIVCKGKRYLDVLDNKVVLLREKVLEDFNSSDFSCAYKPILRNPKKDTQKADDKIEFGEEHELKLEEDLPFEFVNVLCKVGNEIEYEEFLASTPLKSNVEERCEENWKKHKIGRKLNIIVIGIDSISKLNFERHFKLTAEYLRKNLSLFEFHGYMKVADNTFPNLTPMLTGHFVEQYYTSYNAERYFDDLDFIWKNYSSLGYRTFLAEDAPDMATYNYLKNGFQFLPTDYFFRPLTLAMEAGPWWKNSSTDCYQAKPEIIVLFDYLRSFLMTMKERPFFAFTWAARLTHGKLNKAGFADKPAFELIRDINEMGLLNSSLVIFMSDHGIRFGDIRETYIGKIEERMPFLFLSLPQWFLKAYPEAAKNLNANQNRLITPFDLHETLVDIYQLISGNKDYKATPYGISLFNEISTQRNCESAYILPHWCVCHEHYKIANDGKLAMVVAELLVEKVNNLTSSYRKRCALLKLDQVLDARSSKPSNDMLKYEKLKYEGSENSIKYGKTVDFYTELLITVKVSPGGAEFESTIRVFKHHVEMFDISRINMYGSQGDCVNESEMRKYCYCYR